MALVRLAEGATSDADGQCVDAFLDDLSHASNCGGAAGLIASTLALDGVLAAPALHNVTNSSGSCTVQVVGGVAASSKVSPDLVEVIERWARRQRDPMLRSGGFVVLGALARTARGADDHTLAEDIDAELAQELRHANRSTAQRVQLLEAAGNAGCALCLPSIRAGEASTSAEMRRAAVGALRFIESAQAVQEMCGVLEADQDDTVRDQAAWALSWGREAPTDRVHALVRAASRDLSAHVRVTAATSLATLAKDIPLARSALLALTDAEFGDEQVREIALGVVSAVPPKAFEAEDEHVAP